MEPRRCLRIGIRKVEDLRRSEKLKRRVQRQLCRVQAARLRIKQQVDFTVKKGSIVSKKNSWDQNGSTPQKKWRLSIHLFGWSYMEYFFWIIWPRSSQRVHLAARVAAKSQAALVMLRFKVKIQPGNPRFQDLNCHFISFLVGGLVAMNFIFPWILGIAFIIPIDSIIFQDGVAKNHLNPLFFWQKKHKNLVSLHWLDMHRWIRTGGSAGWRPRLPGQDVQVGDHG